MANSAYPTLILLEEMDAYLHADQKAQVLNVLDGSEAALNPKGTGSAQPQGDADDLHHQLPGSD